MTRRTSEIRQDLEANAAERRRVDAHRKQLEAELEDARYRETLNAKARRVYERMFDGDYPVFCASGLWWCRDGELLGRLESPELDGLHHLKEQGIVTQETRA